jgi:TRAP-type mannitol/chloroaromatic compound transport system permease small subunit
LGMVVILVGGWKFAWMSVKAKETMPTVWAPPYYTMKMLLPIGALLMLLQGICNFIKDLNTVHGNKENN